MSIDSDPNIMPKIDLFPLPRLRHFGAVVADFAFNHHCALFSDESPARGAETMLSEMLYDQPTLSDVDVSGAGYYVGE